MESQIKNTITVRTYRVLERAVEDGILCGWNRAHKHTDEPEPDALREEIQSAVMLEISEWFKFDDEE